MKIEKQQEAIVALKDSRRDCKHHVSDDQVLWRRSSVKPYMESLANASWDHPVQVQPECRENETKETIAQHEEQSRKGNLTPGASPTQVAKRNVLFEKDTEIHDLLALLRSNDFAGKIDPKHHSQFLCSPDETYHSTFGLKKSSSCRGGIGHKSEGHLLKKRGNGHYEIRL